MSGTKVLVTGGAGYIGSHTVLEMLNEGYEVTVMDNLHNSTTESLARVKKLTGKTVEFKECDLLDVAGMEAIFKATKYDAVIHFAGLKAVGESVAKPIFYYESTPCAHETPPPLRARSPPRASCPS